MNIPSPTTPSALALAGSTPGIPTVPGVETEPPAGAASSAALTAFAALLDASALAAPPSGSTVTAVNPAENLFAPASRSPAGTVPATGLDGDDSPPGLFQSPAKRAPWDEDSALPATAMYFASAPVPVTPDPVTGVTAGTADATADILTTCEPEAGPASAAPAIGRLDHPEAPGGSPAPVLAPGASPSAAPTSGVGPADLDDTTPAGGRQNVPNGNGEGIGLAVRQDAGLPAGRQLSRAERGADWTPPGKDGAPGIGGLVRELTPAGQGPSEAASPPPGASVPTTADLAGQAHLPPSPERPSQGRIGHPAPAEQGPDGAPTPAATVALPPWPVREARQEKNADLQLSNLPIARNREMPAVSPVTNDGALALDDDPVNPAPTPVGIAGATSSNAMRKSTDAPVSTSLGRARDPEPVDGTREIPLAIPAPDSASAPNAARVAEPPVATPSASAHAVAAIEAAVDAVNHARIAGHSSVELKLTFADSTQLAVRVELRDGTLHTTFRTDSAELRDVLAHEWTAAVPALAAASRDHALRVADPVFDRAAPGFLSLGSSTGGQAQSRETSMPEGAAMLPRTPAGRPEVPAEPLSVTLPDPRRTGASLLNTFA